MAKYKNENRNKFLLSFFKSVEGKEAMEINGFVLLKHWDGNMNEWSVSIYSQESYNKMQEVNKKYQSFKNQQTLL